MLEKSFAVILLATLERSLAVILLAALINIIFMSKNRFFFFETRWLLPFFDKPILLVNHKIYYSRKRIHFLEQKLVTNQFDIFTFHLFNKKNPNILKLNLKTFKIKSKLIFLIIFMKNLKFQRNCRFSECSIMVTIAFILGFLGIRSTKGRGWFGASTFLKSWILVLFWPIMYTIGVHCFCWRQ